MTLEVRPPPAPDLPQLPRPPFLHAVLTTPADQTGACRFSSLFARPSPVNRRVGIHDFTFEACSSFTRVTACKIARPPKGGLLSRGFDPASYPTKPLGSYHVLPTTTCVDPPSTGDLRRWGALLTKCRRKFEIDYLTPQVQNANLWPPVNRWRTAPRSGWRIVVQPDLTVSPNGAL